MASRRRVLARIGAGIGAVVAAVAVASPAWAATGRIDGYTFGDDGTLRISFSAVGLAPGQTIDLGSVVTSVGGETLDSKASPATATNTPDRSTMLTIDLSGSMSQALPGGGTRIAAAKQAAQAYLAGVPKDVKVGLVTFSNSPAVVVKPTTDHAAVAAAVAKLDYVKNGSTALYAGVIAANQALGTDGLRNQLLLSDGANEDPGGPTLQDAVKSTVSTSTTVDAVSVGADTSGKSQLDAITKAGKGVTVTAANADDLTAYFKSAAETQANQIVVDVTVPAAFAGSSKNVVVTAKAGAETITGTTVAQFPSGGPTPTKSDDYGPIPVPVPEAGLTSQPWFLPLAIGLVGLGLFVVLAFAFLATDRDNMQTGRVRRRLARYSLSSRDEKSTAPPTSGVLGQSAVARSAAEFAGRVAQRTDVDTGLARKLDAAGLPLRPGEWMIVHIGIAVLAALVTALLTGFNWLAVLLVFVVGLIGPWLYLSMKEDRRKKQFGEALPETLQLIAGSLAAGYSLPQAVDTVVRESEGPMAVELNRALVEARLGVPIEDALEATAIRMESVDFQWVVMALRIQREVGGNLAEVLTNVAATMRERERLRRQVNVLSAEGRLSAIILGALPVVFVIYLVLVRPEYLALLVTTPLGILMIVVGLVLLIAGAFWLRSVVKVEV